MARAFTARRILSGSITKVDDINLELNGVLGEFNGKLDQHNMPMMSVSSGSMSGSVIYSSSPTVGSQGQFNAFYYAGPYQTPTQYSPTLGNVGVGWNDIPSQCTLSFAAQEGMVKGSAVICGESYPNKTTSGGLTTEADISKYWWEGAVFANEIMVAQSGYIYGHKFTIDLPFAFPVGNDDTVIQFRWQSPMGADWNTAVTDGKKSTPFNLSGSFIWVRNEMR